MTISTPWQYTDATHLVVFYTDELGAMHSALVSSPNVEAWIAAGNTPAAEPAPSLAQQAAAVIAAGCAIQSAGTPTLNGTYAIDDAARANITAEALYIQATQAQGQAKFTNGQATKAWPDKTGARHEFTTAQFIDFAEKIAEFYDAFLAALDASMTTGAAWSPPAQPVMLAA
jgi:hypothetical protein